LRADCIRFLEELRALIGRRAELLAGSTGWVPEGPRRDGSEHPSTGEPPTTPWQTSSAGARSCG